MTSASPAPAERAARGGATTWREALRRLATRRMAVAALMGFSAGLPLLLTYGVLQAWMTAEGVDLGTIGLFTLVHLPYSLKFLWAPLADRFVPPFLGRRRGWLLAVQLLLMAAIFALGRTEPGLSPLPVVVLAFAVTLLSATQDLVVDAYRREDLPDEELGLGSSYYVGGYRLGMLLASGGGLILADSVGFPSVYAIMAGAMSIGVVTTLLTPEPARPPGTPETLRSAVVDPFREFFRRPHAALILVFMVLYKLGDLMANAMSIPFFLAIGFTNAEIGAVYKLFGTAMTIAGALVGGTVMLRIGIYRSLWIFGVLQMLSTAAFAWLAEAGRSLFGLALVILGENLSSGLGTAAFLGFMALLTDKRFTATQYALLTALTSVARSLFSAPTGYLAEAVGWTWFFIACTLIAIPGLVLLGRFAPWGATRTSDVDG